MKTEFKNDIGILYLIIFFFVLFSAGCNSGSNMPSELPQSSPLAINATYDFNPETGNPQAEIEDDPRYGKIVRTIIEIGFSKEATVDEFNSLIASIDGQIINMLEGVAIIIVRIPDPGNILALEIIIQELELSPIVRFAGMGHIPDLAALPDNYTYDHTDNMHMIDHNLAVRGHAAWNVREALQNTGLYSPPLVIVPDQYGKGRPVSDYGFDITGSDFLPGAADPREHGYHVIGVIGADYGGAENDRGWATGLYPAVFPNLLPLRVIDLANGLTREQADFKLIELIKENSGQNIVVNTSLGFPCETQDEVDENCSQENAEEEALKWIETLRDAGVEGDFVHVTAGGNSYVAGDNKAKFASQYTAAKLLTGLEDCWIGIACTPIENISNALVVENQMNSANVPYQPTCLYHESKIGGDISAIGTKVWSLYDPSATSGDSLNGTSIASPQVAALAAYVWALKPTLNNQDVINILKNSSRDAASWDPTSSSECSNEPPSPIIDAYAAVLSVDTPSNAKVRMTLLDVANDFGAEVPDGVFHQSGYHFDFS